MDTKGIKQVIKEIKVDYPRMTFRLSVFGFIASIAFYLGVLREVYEPKDKKDQKIEQLSSENNRLKKHVDLLSEKQHKD